MSTVGLLQPGRVPLTERGCTVSEDATFDTDTDTAADGTSQSGAATAAGGGCRCGGVRYRVEGALRSVAYCHCEDCRRITGHHMAASAAAADDLVFAESETLCWYSAQPLVHYGFCNRCGSTLFWKADDKPETVSICAGTLDQPTGLTTTLVLFGDEVADYIVERPAVETFGRDRR